MNKAQALRDFLSEAIPALKTNPDRMLVFIDRGGVVCRATASLAFEYDYTLNLILTDYAGHPDSVMAPLLAWVRVNQPDLVQNPEKAKDGVKFTADILDNGSVDLSITLPLTERVGVKARTDGGYDVHHLPEPRLVEDLGPRHWRLFLEGVDQPIAEWDAPA